MKIEFHGDSTQAGYESWNGIPVITKIPPHVGVAQLVKYHHGDGHVITCFAQGGSTAKNALERSNFYPSGTFAQHVAQSDADIIVANWGINDAYTSGNTASAHAGRYAQMKNACDAAGIQFIAQTPNPIISNGHNNLIAAFCAHIKALPNMAVIDIHGSITKWYPSWKVHLSDGVHPNSIMYRYIGDTLYNGLKSRF